VHPEVVGFEHLFDDVACTPFASVVFGDVFGDGLDFGTCIGGAYGESASLHDFVVGDVVAHIHDFVVAEVVLGAELFVHVDFLCYALMDFGESESLVAVLYGFGGGSGDDGEEELVFHCMLHGIAVFDVDGSHGFA